MEAQASDANEKKKAGKAFARPPLLDYFARRFFRYSATFSQMKSKDATKPTSAATSVMTFAPVFAGH
jgi:hypothetical protein